MKISTEHRDALNEALDETAGYEGDVYVFDVKHIEILRSAVIAMLEDDEQIATVAPAVDAQPVACLICNSTGNATPCAYPTEINRQQAARIERLRKEDLSLRALYEDACVQANKNAKDAERYRWMRRTFIADDESWPDDVSNATTGEELDAAVDAALSQHTGEKDD